MSTNISCPVSVQKTDGSVARLAALSIAVIVIAGLLLQYYLLFVLAGIDFALRAFTNGRYSLVKAVSVKAAGILKLKKVPVDAAPKKFAAGLGFVFSSIIAVSFYSGSITTAYTAGFILLACALLEGIFSICLGCHVYSLLMLLFKRKTAANT
jgi:hypothetical protein